MFSFEFCEILKKTYFKGHLQTTVSEEISENPSIGDKNSGNDNEFKGNDYFASE